MRLTSIFLLFVAIAIGCQQQNGSEVSIETAEPANQTDTSTSTGTGEVHDATVADSEDTESKSDEVAVAKPDHEHVVDGDSQMTHEPGPGHGAGMGMGRGMGPGMGMARGMGRGRGFGRGGMGGMRPDMTTIHGMFDNSDKITRTVKLLPDGAEATTESDDEQIANLIQAHVPAMENRVLGNEPLPPMTFHPIFIELIKNSDKYTLDYEETEKGVTVRYTADDPRIVMLVQEHAKLVSRFLKNGMSEIHKPYELPQLESPTETVATPQVRAIAAKDALFKKLSGRLMEVMKSQGPVAAIEVCSREASGIAESISESHCVKIGRTALKLRNPNNQPPYWVAPLMSEEATEPTFVDLPGGHTGALLPIRLQSKCLTCHGGDEIPDAVQSKLAEFYPDDKATGFKEGDLRGWFWVDVPDDKQRQSKLEDVQ